MAETYDVDDAVYGPELEVDYDSPAPPIRGRTRAGEHLAQAARIRADAEAELILMREALDRIGEERDRLVELYVGIEASRDSRAGWHERAVENWHRAARADDPDFPKTIKFPHGTSSSKKAPAKLTLDDAKADEMRATLEQHHDAETGAVIAEQVWATPKTGEKFYVSELKRALEIHPDDVGLEPNSSARAVIAGQGDDDGNPIVVEGVGYVIQQDTHKATTT